MPTLLLLLLSCQDFPAPEAENRCGVFAIQLALASIGRVDAVGEVESFLHPTAEGLAMSEIAKAATSVDCPARCVKFHNAPLLRVGESAAVIRIIHPDLGPHFVAITQSDHESATVMDFPWAESKIPWTAIRQDLQWDGTALMIGSAAESSTTFRHAASLEPFLWGVLMIIALLMSYPKRRHSGE